MPSNQEKRVEAMKQVRRMLQMAMQSVELDADDVASISLMIDEWQPGSKYKKGMLAQYAGISYRCTANVNKSDVTPDLDSDHWQRADMASDGIPLWSEPTGKGYAKGNKVHYPDSDGTVYVSQKNNNTAVPGTDDKYWLAE